MASLNKVFLLGNLTRDPDLRALPSGQSVCELRLAVSRRYQNANGQEVDDTCFVDVVVWGRSANNCRQYLTKGSQVMVEGRLQLDQWEDRNGGGQRSKLRVVAEQIQFMSRRNGGEGGEGGGSYAPRNADSGYAPRDNGGAAPVRDAYAPRQMDAAPGGFERSARPAASAPAMPDPSFGPGEAPMEDDIPF